MLSLRGHLRTSPLSVRPAAASSTIGSAPHQRAHRPTTLARWTSTGTSAGAGASVAAARAPIAVPAGGASSSPQRAPLPAVLKGLYRSLLRVSAEYDRFPVLKGAFIHPAADKIYNGSSDLDEQLRHAAKTRQRVLAALAQREHGRRQTTLAAQNLLLSKGAKKPIEVEKVKKRTQPTPPPSIVDQINSLLAAARQNHTGLSATAAALAAAAGKDHLTDDELDAAIEARVRQEFFRRVHSPLAPLATRFFWLWIDRFFRRRQAEWIVDRTNEAPIVLGVKDLPKEVQKIIEGVQKDVALAADASDAAKAAAIASNATAATAATTSAAGTAPAVSSSATPVPFTLLSMSPNDPPGTFTPAHYIPTRGLRAHVRKEFRLMTKRPTEKQYAALTQALFDVLRWLNEEKIFFEFDDSSTSLTNPVPEVHNDSAAAAAAADVDSTPNANPSSSTSSSSSSSLSTALALAADVDSYTRQWTSHMLTVDLPASLLETDPAAMMPPPADDVPTENAPSQSGDSAPATTPAQPPSPPLVTAIQLIDHFDHLVREGEQRWEREVLRRLLEAKKKSTGGKQAPTTVAAPPAGTPAASSLAPAIPMPAHWSLRPTHHLRAGTILAAHPQVTDDQFVQSVILLTRVDVEANLVQGVFLNNPYQGGRDLILMDDEAAPPPATTARGGKNIEEDEEALRKEDDDDDDDLSLTRSIGLGKTGRTPIGLGSDLRKELRRNLKLLGEARLVSREAAGDVADESEERRVEKAMAALTAGEDSTGVTTGAGEKATQPAGKQATTTAAASLADLDFDNDDDDADYSEEAYARLLASESDLTDNFRRLRAMLLRFYGAAMYGGPVTEDLDAMPQSTATQTQAAASAALKRKASPFAPQEDHSAVDEDDDAEEEEDDYPVGGVRAFTIHPDEVVVLHRRKDWALKEAGLMVETTDDSTARPRDGEDQEDEDEAEGKKSARGGRGGKGKRARSSSTSQDSKDATSTSVVSSVSSPSAPILPASLLHPLIPARVEVLPCGRVREVSPAVFVGKPAHWQEVLAWACESDTWKGWTRKGEKLLGKGANRDTHQEGGASAPAVAADGCSGDSSSSPPSSVVAPPSSLVHSWDFAVFHGRVEWSYDEFRNQLASGDWFAFEGSAAHVFTGVVPARQVEERTRHMRELIQQRMDQAAASATPPRAGRLPAARKGSKQQRAGSSSRANASAKAGSLKTSRSSSSRKAMDTPRRQRKSSSVAHAINWHDGAPEKQLQQVPFELVSSPTVTAEVYADVVRKVAQATHASPTEEADVVRAATAHLPFILFPRRRLWNHAMYQLKGEGRHWAYIPKVGLDASAGQGEEDEDDDDDDDDDDDGDEDDEDGEDDEDDDDDADEDEDDDGTK